MRAITAGLVTLGLVALVGCNTSPPGGSGGSRGTAGSGGATSRSATFDINAPGTTTNLKQGETKEVKVTVKRGKDFHDDVTVKFDAPQGLKVDPATVTVKAGDAEDVAVKVTAEATAPVGDHKINVSGTPKSGSAVAVDFTVKVEKAG